MNKTFGPDVYCPESDDYTGTHRSDNDGPFFCMDCGSTTHTALVSTSQMTAMDTRLEAALFDSDAMLAHLNGVWHNTLVWPGHTHGPVSGDAITESIAYSASRRAIENAARRPALEIAAR